MPVRDGGLVYHVVDVFADRPFSGNPLAVVLDADELSGDQMQQLAREFNLSETAFPLAPTASEREQGADYRLRIFTPEVELPFAGHPSVGTAWLLHKLRRLRAGQVHQLCGEGLLPLDVDERAVTLTGGASVLGEPIDPAPALTAVGLSETDLVDLSPRIASTGLAYAILPVAADALASCEPDIATLRSAFSFPHEASGVYVVAWGESPHSVQARMFAGDIGAAEDPATGSAALALSVYLAGAGLIADGSSVIDVEQGVSMGRPSRLRVACDVSDGQLREARVSGTVVHIAEGTIAVP
jgi:trans-2,3-dihydro-3-hydroxyanthranilate isomerase